MVMGRGSWGRGEIGVRKAKRGGGGASGQRSLVGIHRGDGSRWWRGGWA